MGIRMEEEEEGIRIEERKSVYENINGVPGRGVSFKTSTFPLVLMRILYGNKQLGGTAVKLRKGEELGTASVAELYLHTFITKSCVCRKQIVTTKDNFTEIVEHLQIYYLCLFSTAFSNSMRLA